MHHNVKRLRIRLYGLVQGIGFRPFVAEQAESLGLSGKVKNNGGMVTIDAAGDEEAMEEFLRRLLLCPPPGARIERMEKEEIGEAEEGKEAAANSHAAAGDGDPKDYGGTRRFYIVPSEEGEEPLRLLPPDLCTCADCERELFTETDRRFRHPFISCRSCGPRYSIESKVPYDRENLTMADFPMCRSCEAEYLRQKDRRRHAQTIACRDCGPRLLGYEIQRDEAAEDAYPEEGRRGRVKETEAGERRLPDHYGEDALRRAEEIILSGGIAAVLDIGGFHFVFLPEKEPAERLRSFKHREAKPFALCFPDLPSIREYCRVSPEEEALLTSPARPIVLLEKVRNLPEEILSGSRRIGAMLPCNPLQLLLTRDLGKPLVMTSGNRGNEPIVTATEDMLRLAGEGACDYVLTHERRILSPLDDSIYQVTELAGRKPLVQILRRARGIVPEPVILKDELTKPIYAAGGDLKSVFALGKGRGIYLSPYFGDLQEESCAKARERELSRMKDLFQIRPSLTLGDLHPAYLSSRGVSIRVQHHYAHILSVMAEHGLIGEALGLAFDGTGYGADGTVWGSEFLLCRGAAFEKLGSLLPINLFGGDAGAKDASLSLAAYRFAAGLPVDQTQQAALSARIGTVKSSSMGRLFDAAAALLSVCSFNTYEGQCASALETLAETTDRETPLSLPLLSRDGKLYGDGPSLIRQLYEAKDRGIPLPELARGFHRAIADFAVAMTARLLPQGAETPVLLSGGTFANRLLLRILIPALESRGYTVHTNEKVPCSDSGLALGQAYYSLLRTP